MRSKTAKPGEWIIGRGWHQEKWTNRPEPNVEGFPTHASLDAVSPNNPVLLTHASGHASFVNAKAMEISDINRTTPNPPGGEILKDAAGNPTGLLRETASGLVHTNVGDPARARKALALASQEVLTKGITSFQDAGSSFATIDLMKQMIDQGQIGVRLWVMVREGNTREAPLLAKYRTIDSANGHLTVRAIKRQIDGALGSRGAWLLEPYSDKPDSVGLNTASIADITETARMAMANDYQLCIHAIGDRANRETLNIFEQAFKANPTKHDLRWRIEHAQHLSLQDIPRFGQLGVIASMQGIHCTSDAPYVLERLGAQARRGRGVCLAKADEERRGREQRNGRAGRGRRPDSELLRDRQPEDEGRAGVLSGSANEPDGSAEVVHDECGVRRVRGVIQGIAESGQARGRDRAVKGHHDRS